MNFSFYAKDGGPFSHLEEKAHTQTVDFEVKEGDNQGENATAAEAVAPNADTAPSERADMPSEDVLEAARLEAKTAERARCAAIFADASAGSNIAAAAKLAFETDMTAEQAVSLLGTLAPAAPVQAQQAKRSLSADMATQQKIDVGQGGENPQSTTADQVQFILNAAAKASGG